MILKNAYRVLVWLKKYIKKHLALAEELLRKNVKPNNKQTLLNGIINFVL